MRIWIDLANSPHVLFFRRIVRVLESQCHTVEITARDFAQTIGLADELGLEYEKIGGHGGKAAYRKGLNLLIRSFALMKWAYRQHIDLAVSHNSYSQSVAAFLAGIPSVTMMDYEYQPANHLSFRLARRVIVPKAFPEEALRFYGVASRKVKRYSGLKEEVYLSSFVPDSAFLTKLGLDSRKIIATVRPPAVFSLYHRFDNPLFLELMEWLGKRDDVLIVFLPRTDAQRELFLRRDYRNVFIPSCVLDGPNLLFHSDLVISAGGTMNREAAVLGTPAYTIFAGRIPAVDDYLIKMGKMMRIQSKSDFAKIELRKNDVQDFRPLKQSVLEEIVDMIMDVPNIGAKTSGARASLHYIHA
jgi:hypothetical protein